MQASHAPSAVSASFDDPNLVSCAGLASVVVLADACGLAGLVAEKLSVPSPNARLNVPALVAGMVAGAESIEDKRPTSSCARPTHQRHRRPQHCREDHRFVPDLPDPRGRRLGRTLRQWRQHVPAYFTSSGVSNGGTEAINLLIEKTRRLHGFRNFDKYRPRILLVANGSRLYRQHPNHAQ
jgi:hypothetical protein